MEICSLLQCQRSSIKETLETLRNISEITAKISIQTQLKTSSISSSVPNAKS